MIKNDNLFTGEEVQKKLIAGIQKVATAVGGTMGTGGSNAIIEAIENPGHFVTNDGYTIANSIVLADPIEDMGRKILLESINRSNKASGDGSSTTCVLTAAVITEGMKRIAEAHPMAIKKSLEDCYPLIEASIKGQTRSLIVAGDIAYGMLEEVTTISSEDPEIGKRISEIYSKIGKSGIIHWDVSKTGADSYTIGSGITVEGASFFSPYMCDADDKGQNTNQIRLANPYILISKQKIASASDFNNIAAALNGKEIKDLVVFVDDIDPLTLPDIIKTRMVRGFRIAVVKMPTLWKDQWFEDLAAATGATIADPALGMPLKEMMLLHLGTCGNILITKDDTFLDGIKDMSSQIGGYEAEGSDDSKLRASRLNTKTARYYVGALSDSALSHRRLKVEDAISAAYHALNGGIVAGGGVALRECVGVMPDTVGGNILRVALQAPTRQIMDNAGYVGPTGASIGDTEITSFGIDTRSGKIVDMFEAGIVDPAVIVLNAAKNAISVAAAILTAKSVVTLPREEMPQMMMPPVLR